MGSYEHVISGYKSMGVTQCKQSCLGLDYAYALVDTGRLFFISCISENRFDDEYKDYGLNG